MRWPFNSRVKTKSQSMIEEIDLATDLSAEGDNGDPEPKAANKSLARKKNGSKTIFIAAELSLGTTDVWRVTADTSDIVHGDSIPDNAHVIRFTSKDVSTPTKGKNRKALRTELMVMLNDSPVVLTARGVAYATTKEGLNQIGENRQTPGAALLTAADTKKRRIHTIYGVAAHGTDPIAVAIAIDVAGEIKGRGITTDITEHGKAEVVRRARQDAEFDSDAVVVWITASQIIQAAVSHKILYPIDGEFAGRPATYWGSVALVAGTACLAASGGYYVTEMHRLHAARDELNRYQSQSGIAVRRIEKILREHIEYVQDKNSVNYTTGIEATQKAWQPGEQASLSMSAGQTEKKGPQIYSAEDKLPENSIDIEMHPFIGSSGVVSDNGKLWMNPTMLLRKLHKSAPKGYQPGIVHMSPDGSSYEVVYEKNQRKN